MVFLFSSFITPYSIFVTYLSNSLSLCGSWSNRSKMGPIVLTQLATGLCWPKRPWPKRPWSNRSWTKRPWLARFRGAQVVTKWVGSCAFVPVGPMVILGVGLILGWVEWFAAAVVGLVCSWLCVWWF